MDEALKNRQAIEEIKRAYTLGEITREEAKEKAQPIIDRINAKGKEIAKKYNKKYSPLGFVGLMR